MKSALSIIISREYLERVKRKSFIISTLLIPIFMVAMMFAPALIMIFNEPERASVAVIDDTGVIASHLKDSEEISFVTYDGTIDEARSDEDTPLLLVIGSKAISNPQTSIRLYTRGAPSISTDAYITGQLKQAITDERLKAYNIENLQKILKEVEVDLMLQTVRIDQDEEKGISSILNYILALSMDMMLYMFILIYGQMVMTSIIEEKNNRVLEIVVSSVKPTSLMLGKIIGIGLVAITQIMIWGVILAVCSGWAVPLIGSMPEAAAEPEIAGALAQLSDTGFFAGLFVNMILFFISGYLFYSAIYAAIGSAVDNVQDASQLSSIATLPVIVGIIASMAVINNPGSALSFWLSVLIPFTSPMAMMSRLPFGVPLWQIAISLAILCLSILGLIWICAKIYRVGIFMYGKKPSLPEIIRWARYK